MEPSSPAEPPTSFDNRTPLRSTDFDDPNVPRSAAQVRQALQARQEEDADENLTFKPRINRASQRLVRTPAQLQAWNAAKLAHLEVARLAQEQRHETFAFSPKTTPYKNALAPPSSSSVFDRLTKPHSPVKTALAEKSPVVVADNEQQYDKSLEFLKAKEAARLRVIEAERALADIRITPRTKELAVRRWTRVARQAFELCAGFDGDAIPLAEFDAAMGHMGIAVGKDRDAVLDKIREAVVDADGLLHVAKFQALLERVFGRSAEDAFAQRVAVVLAEASSPPRAVKPPLQQSPGKPAVRFTDDTVHRLFTESPDRRREELERIRQRVAAERDRELTFSPQLAPSSSRVPVPPRAGPVHIELHALAAQAETARRKREDEHARKQKAIEMAACSFRPHTNAGAAAGAAAAAAAKATDRATYAEVHVARQHAARALRDDERRRLDALGKSAAAPALVINVDVGTDSAPRRIDVAAGDVPEDLVADFCARWHVSDPDLAARLNEAVRDAMRAHRLLPEQMDGWELHYDGDCRRWFFHHPGTGASSWTRPASCPDPSLLPLCVPET